MIKYILPNSILLIFILIMPSSSTGADLSSELTSAARTGDLTRVKALINQGVNPNVYDIHGYTALTGASFYGKKDIVEFLITNGADINIRAKDGPTALIQACFRSHKSIVKLLLKNGADVNRKSSANGWTPLMTAATTVKNDNEIINMLLAYGAKIDERNNDSATALLLVSAICDRDTANYLIANGANTKIRTNSGLTYSDLLSAKRCKEGLK